MAPTARCRPARPETVSLALMGAFAALLSALFAFVAARPAAAATSYVIGSPNITAAMHTPSTIYQSFRTKQAGQLTDFTYFYKSPGSAAYVKVYLLKGSAISTAEFVDNWSLFPADNAGFISEQLPRPITLEADTTYYLQLFVPEGSVHFGYSIADSYPGGELVGDTTIMPGGDLAFELAITTNESSPAPGIAVSGGAPSVDIADLASAPNAADGTDFGAVALGQSVTREFTITNGGTAELAIDYIIADTKSGGKTPSNHDFAVVEPYPTAIAPGASATFGVKFAPTAAGQRTGVILIANSASDDGLFSFTASGEGAEAPILNEKVPPATYGSAYFLDVNGGGYPMPQFSLIAGALPPGLTLDAHKGAIYGTPSEAGSFDFTLTAENSAGTDEQAYTLVASPALLYIIPRPEQTKVYGDPLPAIAYETQGFLLKDTREVLTGALSAVEPPGKEGPGATVGPQTPVGSYAITLGTLAAKNYSLMLKAPLLVVTPRPLSVSAQSVRVKAGAATPESFELIYGNFAEGEGPSTLSERPTASVPTRPADLEATGSFPIELAGGADANYTLDFTSNAGTLTVTTRDIPVISWGDQGALPGLSYGQTLAESLTARASFSGQPVSGSFTYRLMPAGTPVDASTVLGAGTGLVLEVAFTPADPAAFAAVSRQVTLDVARAPLLITADGKAITKGQPLPALTAGYKGFVNGDDPADLDTPPSLSTTATAGSPVGAYKISVDGAADANYAITFVAGTLSIDAQPPALKALNGVTGRPGSAFVFRIEGFAPGEEVLVLLRGGRVFKGGQVLRLVIGDDGAAGFILDFPQWLQPGVYEVEVVSYAKAQPRAAATLAISVATSVTLAESAPLLSAPEGGAMTRTRAMLQWYLPIVWR